MEIVLKVLQVLVEGILLAYFSTQLYTDLRVIFEQVMLLLLIKYFDGELLLNELVEVIVHFIVHELAVNQLKNEMFFLKNLNQTGLQVCLPVPDLVIGVNMQSLYLILQTERDEFHQRAFAAAFESK